MSQPVTLKTELPGSPLNKSDLRQLAKCYITPELAEQALLRRVTSVDGAQIVGRKPNANYAGILFPYIWPGEEHVTEYRLRRDAPDIEIRAGNERKETQKYLGPPGRGNRLYFVPGTPPAELENAEMAAVVTEGEKKVLALSRMASSREFLPLGLSGVANWRGTIGKADNANGERVNVRGPIPDLARVTFDRRIVYIVFDADLAVNWQLRMERWKFAQYLTHERGARVRFVEIPAHAKNKGIDDLLAAWKDESRVWELFESSRPADAASEASILIDQVKDTGDIKILFNGAAIFAGMAAAEFAEIKHRIRRELRKEVSISDFENAIKAERARIARQKRGDQPKELRYSGKEYEAADAGMIWWKKTKEWHVPVSLCNFAAEIIADVVRDDGEETTRALRIRATLRNQTNEITVPASEFTVMNWPIEILGAYANVYPTYRDHTRAAIQSISNDIAEQYVYQHTGWTVIRGANVYLHAGGGIGPEGAMDLEVELDRALRHYDLPTPPEGDALITAIHGAIELLEVAPDRIIIPLFSAVWRAVLGPVNVSLFVSGQTGWGKSQLAALIQQFFGPGMNALNLPAGWESTANALESLAFRTKNAILVVDDFVPKGSSSDVQRLHMIADRLLRGQGNASGRIRMLANTTLRPPKPPRGLIVATGEDVPKGHSLRGRMIVCEIEQDDIRWRHLTKCQHAGAAGVYAAAMSGFLRWIAPRMSKMDAELQTHLDQMRLQLADLGQHKRTPDNIGNLAIGFRLFLDYVVESKAISKTEADELWERAQRAYASIVDAQDQGQEADEPCQQYLALVGAAARAGLVHLSGPGAQMPENAEAWGWRSEHPQGTWIGWIEDENLYLDPKLSFAAAQRLARDSSENLPVSQTTLVRRLKQRGLLASTDTGRETATIRRRYRGEVMSVLHFSVDLLSTLHKTRHSRHSRHLGTEGGKMSGFDVGFLGACRVASTQDELVESTTSDTNVGNVGFFSDPKGGSPDDAKKMSGFPGDGENGKPDISEEVAI